jgi:hypothetical protein
MSRCRVDEAVDIVDGAERERRSRVITADRSSSVAKLAAAAGDVETPTALRRACCRPL